MKLIKRIEIKSFRSIYSCDLKEIEDFNIFAGTNDSGKSNLLKALNLFFNNKTSFLDNFNFEKDYSKLALLKARVKKKGRQFISIKIYFDEEAIKGKSSLKKLANSNEGIWVERKWWRFSGTSYEEVYSDFLKDTSQGIKRSFKVFLNSIKFVYIPAFKNEDVFSYILQLAGDTEGVLLDREAKDNLDSKIAETTKQFSNDFSNITNVETTISLPITLESFWSGLQIFSNFEGVSKNKITRGKIEDYFINFSSRGEGIKSIFIPVILGWLAKFTKNRYWIWGIDEPENSIEAMRSVEILKKFSEYSKDSQIFASSHSPIFIFPQIDKSIKNNLTVYMASQKKFGDTSFDLIRNKNKDLLKEKTAKKLRERFGIEYLYFLNIQDEYSDKIQIKDQEIKQLNELLKNSRKPILFVEDSYNQIYKICWLKMKEIDCDLQNFENKFDSECDFEILSKEGATGVLGLLKSTPIDEWKSKKVIGLFDFDDEGFKCFKESEKNRSGCLKSTGGWQEIKGIESECLYRKRKGHECFYAILLPVPEHRKGYASKDNKLNHLSVELLFTDDSLKKIDYYGGTEKLGCGAEVTTIKGKKNAIYKRLFDLEKDDFESFKPLFSKIEELFNQTEE
jgi:AAA15 family ATPase/GTPase